MLNVEKYISPQLRDSNSFYVNVTDLEGNYLYVNNYFTEMFGFITKDFIGKSFAETIAPEDVQKSIDASIACIKNPQFHVPIELRKPLPKGGYYHTQWEFSLLTNEVNEPLGILCIGFDATEQIKQAQELINQQQKAFLFFNNPDKDNFILDLEGNIKELNDAARNAIRRYFNVEVQLGDQMLTYISKDYLPFFEGDLEKVKQGKPVSREIFLNFDSGESAWHIINIVPILDASGKVYELFLSGRNIHPLKSAILTSNQLENKLKKIAWEHSHGLRSPLSNILSFAELLATQSSSASKGDFDFMLNALHEEAKRLDEMIQRIVNETHR